MAHTLDRPVAHPGGWRGVAHRGRVEADSGRHYKWHTQWHILQWHTLEWHTTVAYPTVAQWQTLQWHTPQWHTPWRLAWRTLEWHTLGWWSHGRGGRCPTATNSVVLTKRVRDSDAVRHERWQHPYGDDRLCDKWVWCAHN